MWRRQVRPQLPASGCSRFPQIKRLAMALFCADMRSLLLVGFACPEFGPAITMRWVSKGTANGKAGQSVRSESPACQSRWHEWHNGESLGVRNGTALGSVSTVFLTCFLDIQIRIGCSEELLDRCPRGVRRYAAAKAQPVFSVFPVVPPFQQLAEPLDSDASLD